ncbi:MAG: helix-turn-helix transcriptional regulator [Clostridia bacterium]|nr:helix-turn-helix transcriptional regulator [Clostridia bacterium]
MLCFNKRLKELRTSKGLSQQALADKIGVSKSSINMYERGEREPSISMLFTLADLFEVDLNYLLGYTPSNKSNKSPFAAEP